ncbi:ATP-binding protein [Spongiactinospora sp. TRM90649]|uniref:sensor histidine kinase n=1 Tax=Spongiactinospora sp. TRM90649 TaxID=3031114 RepID=UPI0023F70188|nr:ATP-binding protein [Spongiactinospora sp. TRM90649]MDF5758534.1 ATP-binding protein [Spongiactinospora sp. TRM90649]
MRSLRARITITALLVFGVLLIAVELISYLVVHAATRTPVPTGTLGPEIGLMVLAVVLIALAGWSIWRAVGHSLASIERIRREMTEITASDLTRRMPVPAEGEPSNEVDRLAETVNRTLDRLERAVEHERQFASDASHELRTPLTGLRTRIEFALADQEDTDPWQTLREVLGDADRIQAIVEDLHTLSRMDSGYRPHKSRVDLAALTRAVLTETSLKMRVSADLGRSVPVPGEAEQLKQLVSNLLTNADRHANSEVAVSVTASDGRAVLEVSDDGGGIPPADRERVFQRFTRLDTARSRSMGGTGLGLSIARDIATAHGGRLRVEDPPRGSGTRMVLRLPMAPPSPPSPRALPDEETAREPGTRRRASR